MLKAWSSACGGPEVAEPLGDGAWEESAGHLGGGELAGDSGTLTFSSLSLLLGQASSLLHL